MAKTDLRGWAALHSAAYLAHASLVGGLLGRAVADIDVEYMDGRTPVWAAVEVGGIDAIEVLIRYGANLSPVDRHGRFVLCYNWPRRGETPTSLRCCLNMVLKCGLNEVVQITRPVHRNLYIYADEVQREALSFSRLNANAILHTRFPFPTPPRRIPR